MPVSLNPHFHFITIFVMIRPWGDANVQVKYTIFDYVDAVILLIISIFNVIIYDKSIRVFYLFYILNYNYYLKLKRCRLLAVVRLITYTCANYVHASERTRHAFFLSSAENPNAGTTLLI